MIDSVAITELLGEPADVVRAKLADRLTSATRRFVERSPFVLLATAAADGRCDVSPRGDPAGFVRILDARTLLLPDRPDNRLADSLRNILANPHAGLLFLIPGLGETLRVNGRASVVTDMDILEPCAIDGKVPTLGRADLNGSVVAYRPEILATHPSYLSELWRHVQSRRTAS